MVTVVDILQLAAVAWGGTTAVHQRLTAAFEPFRSTGFVTAKTTVEMSELKTKRTALQARIHQDASSVRQLFDSTDYDGLVFFVYILKY